MWIFVLSAKTTWFCLPIHVWTRIEAFRIASLVSLLFKMFCLCWSISAFYRTIRVLFRYTVCVFANMSSRNDVGITSRLVVNWYFRREACRGIYRAHGSITDILTRTCKLILSVLLSFRHLKFHWLCWQLRIELCDCILSETFSHVFRTFEFDFILRESQ